MTAEGRSIPDYEGMSDRELGEEVVTKVLDGWWDDSHKEWQWHHASVIVSSSDSAVLVSWMGAGLSIERVREDGYLMQILDWGDHVEVNVYLPEEASDPVVFVDTPSHIRTILEAALLTRVDKALRQ